MQARRVGVGVGEGGGGFCNVELWFKRGLGERPAPVPMQYRQATNLHVKVREIKADE